jgi:hypothetical protein
MTSKYDAMAALVSPKGRNAVKHDYIVSDSITSQESLNGESHCPQ